MIPADYPERVYAGLLGKLIGVYLGRPFEGWTYEALTARFGEITGYVHAQFGQPLIVTDDDLTGSPGGAYGEVVEEIDVNIGRLLARLKELGLDQDTLVIFTSDNGYFVGEHRFSRGKLLPYEPALRVPMVIRGPGIRKGTASVEPMANQDIAPTLMSLAGSRPGRPVDGRSMIPYWKNPKKKSRRPILISSYQLSTHLIPGDYPPDTPDPVQTRKKGGQASGKAANQNYVGIRLGPYKYVEYESGDGELYILSRDPAELYNRYGYPRYAKIQRYLDQQLEILRGCKGRSCRAEAPPWPGLPGG